MTQLAFFLLSVATSPKPAVVQDAPPAQVEMVVHKAPSIPVETKSGAKAWFHPAPGEKLSQDGE